MKNSVGSVALFLTFAIPALTGAYRLLQRQQDPCDAQCNNVYAAYFGCFDDACLCPRLLASGLACSSCLANLDADPTDAASVGSDYSSCKAGTGPTPTADPCDRQCSNIGMAYLTCSDDACFCPPMLTSGSACISCLITVDEATIYVSTIRSDYIGCEAETGLTLTSGPISTQRSTTVTPFTLSTSTPAPSLNTKPTSSSQGINSTPSVSQAKSGARGLASNMFEIGYIPMIMFIAMVAGFFSAFV